MMTPTMFFEFTVLGLTAFCLLIAVPLAVMVFRQEHRLKREAALAEIARHALEEARKTTQTGQILAVTTPFIKEKVSTSTFGDRRRVTAPITDLIRPETGPIDLPNEHVPVEPQTK